MQSGTQKERARVYFTRRKKKRMSVIDCWSSALDLEHFISYPDRLHANYQDPGHMSNSRMDSLIDQEFSTQIAQIEEVIPSGRNIALIVLHYSSLVDKRRLEWMTWTERYREKIISLARTSLLLSSEFSSKMQRQVEFPLGFCIRGPRW